MMFATLYLQLGFPETNISQLQSLQLLQKKKQTNCRTTFYRNCWKVVNLKIYALLPNYHPKAIAAMYGAKVPPVDLVKIFEV